MAITVTDGEFIVFSQGVGYGVLVGAGAGFALGMIAISWLLSKYMNEVQDSEMLSTAKRSIGTGLIASAVVSSWTIGSTLLLSCTNVYKLGISAAWFYGAFACVQMIAFSVAAIELKRKAPNAHSSPELFRVRYGKVAHLTMCSYSFLQQLFHTTNLIINGASVFAGLTGISREASCVLLPLFVVMYTLMGGIKATFLTDWTHVVIIYVIMLTFMFKVFTTSDLVGSPDKMWSLLMEASKLNPVVGNQDGSYLTFRSVNGGLFGLILFGSGWANSVNSQLFQKSLACKPKSTLLGYLLGGICWFTLPFCLATSMGSLCRALEHTTAFPLYPDKLSTQQIKNGLVLPIAAYMVMGRGGAAAVLVMVFMACTAAFSSDTIAVGALFTYDIYRPYFDPHAKGKKLVVMTNIGVVIYAVCVVALAIGLGSTGFDVGFITTCCGIVVDVCVVPIFATLFWRKMSAFAFVASTTISTCIAVACWLGYAYSASGVVNMASLSTYKALAAGNMISLGAPVLLVPIFVWLKPDNFDWEIWKTHIHQADDSEFDKENGLENVLNGQELTELAIIQQEQEAADMLRHRNIGFALVAIFVLFFLVLFPMPLYGSKFVFTKTFFRGYVVVAFLWVFFSSGTVILYPIIENRVVLKKFFTVIFTNKKDKKLYSDETVTDVTSSQRKHQVADKTQALVEVIEKNSHTSS